MSYPATVTIDRPERLSNWRPLFHLTLAMPHFLILHTVLSVVASVTAVVAWLSILFTGRLPEGIAAFHSTYVRYRARTFSYMYFLTDRYPPFDYKPSIEDPGGAGITVNVSPRLERKNRRSVLFRLITPFAWVTLVGVVGLLAGLEIIAVWMWAVALVLGAALIPGAVFSVVMWPFAMVASVFAAAAVIVTGRCPEGLFRLMAGWVRIDARLWAYSMLLTDEYPPFSID